MVLAALGFMFSLFMGLTSPRKSGWVVIATFPLLYAMYAVLVPSGFFPLTAVRFAFAVTLGMLFSGFNRDIALPHLLNIRVVILLIIFVSYTSFLKMSEGLMPIIGSYIPGFFVSIVLPFLLIQTKSDLQRLVKIFAWQGAIIGFFVIVEFATEFNPYDFFVIINQSIGENINFEEEIIYRGGFKRVAGLAGNAVDTGYLLALYFPISMWLLLKKGLINKIPTFLIAIGIILLQTRATFVALGFSLVIILYYIGKLRSKIKKTANRLIFRIFQFSILIFTSSILIYPKLFTILSTFVDGMFGEEKGFGVETKINRIPIAISHFFQKPFFGHGSPSYAYNVLMQSDDLPAPIIYFLAGGLVLGIIYLLLLSNLVTSVFKLLKKPLINGYEKIFIILMGGSLLSGVIVVFSNWREKHLLVAFMIYIAVFKIYYLKSKNPTLHKQRD